MRKTCNPKNSKTVNPKHVAQRFCHGNLNKITRKEKNNYEPQNKKKLYEIKWMYMYSHVLLQQVVIAKQKKISLLLIQVLQLQFVTRCGTKHIHTYF